MDKREVYEKLISVIVPVYNTEKEYILECLNSIANQTLNKEDIEIIIVDDCSTSKETLKIINELYLKKDYKGISLKVIKHEKNKWVAKARITGAKNSRGKYLVFLDSDDLIKEDYLKKAVLLLETSPRAGWVYPNVRMFGYLDFFHEAEDFNAFKIFLINYCTNASLIRRETWMQVMQREKFMIGKVHFYEDWDNFTRMIGKGWYGLSLKDSEHLYRQHYSSGGVRDVKLFVLSKYFNFRLNLSSFFHAYLSEYRYKKDLKENFGKKRSIINPIDWLDRFSGFLVNIFLQNSFQSIYIKNNIKFFPFKFFLLGIFNPKKFIKEALIREKALTLAEFYCGFVEKPKLNFFKSFLDKNKKNKTILFANPWWRMGGTEKVLLDWLKATKEIKNLKVLNVVDNSYGLNKKLKNTFERYVDEDYALDRISIAPLIKLKFCWNLIQKEKPEIIFISNNSFFYILTPLIKKFFPATKIVDIIHSEDPLRFSWFAIAKEYQEFIDKRIVISDSWKKVLEKRYKEKTNKIEVFYNGIDLKKYNPLLYNKNSLRKYFGFDTKKIIIGFIGRIDEEKNPFVFLELANLMKLDKEFEFIIIGEGELENELKRRLKLLPNVKFLGSTEDTSKYLSICDLIICPSRFEGYPLASLEAAAMNVPIIATDLIGFREQIEKGKFGILYQQKDQIEDAKKIREIIIENKNKFARIGRNGRKFVIKYHDIKKNSREYKEFIESLLK